MNTLSISRRRFAQLLGAGAACAVVKPAYTFAKDAATAPASPGSLVRLSSNENPYGPSSKALQAMTNAYNIACRYPDDQAEQLVDALAKLNHVDKDQILLGDGSGEILKLCATAFTGPASNSKEKAGRGKLIAADPTFEAILAHAKISGADIVKIPLNASFAHDLPKMKAAARDGLVYICNPNNPTASITPREELHDFIMKMPRQTMILVDEAYHHYADSPDYESVIPLVNDHPNLIVARTFSKIYGMAGLRCGYCVAQKQTIERMRPHQSWDTVNVMALVAATTSLDDEEQVTNGRRLNSEARSFVVSELYSMGYTGIPSQANFIMFDVKRPVVPLIQAMKQHNVQVGRLFPALPNHMRLTIGKKEEMQAFLSAFREVIA
jgi:histidinol-phosphate aminotransferase